MPAYAYGCDNCGEDFTVIAKEPPGERQPCEWCGRSARRDWSSKFAVGVIAGAGGSPGRGST